MPKKTLYINTVHNESAPLSISEKINQESHKAHVEAAKDLENTPLENDPVAAKRVKELRKATDFLNMESHEKGSSKGKKSKMIITLHLPPPR